VIYWKIQLLSFEPKEKLLKVKVENYHEDDVTEFQRQEPKREILALHFEPFDWKKLEPLLAAYQKKKLLPLLFNTDGEKQKQTEVKYKIKGEDSGFLWQEPGGESAIVREIKTTFWIYFSDAKFN